jgi:secondary thiamine-phosphate synthase enzyme
VVFFNCNTSKYTTALAMISTRIYPGAIVCGRNRSARNTLVSARTPRVRYEVKAQGCVHTFVELDTTVGQEVVDITEQIEQAVEAAVGRSDVDGIVTVSSMHTTCGIIVNENEHFLKEDVLRYMNTIVPANQEYGHNVLEKRPATERDRQAIIDNNYGGFSSVEEFMSQEPINAHAHLQAILLGNGQTLGMKGGRLVRGSWQSVMFVELDGPRQRRRASITCMY